MSASFAPQPSVPVLPVPIPTARIPSLPPAPAPTLAPGGADEADPAPAVEADPAPAAEAPAEPADPGAALLTPSEPAAEAFGVEGASWTLPARDGAAAEGAAPSAGRPIFGDAGFRGR